MSNRLSFLFAISALLLAGCAKTSTDLQLTPDGPSGSQSVLLLQAEPSLKSELNSRSLAALGRAETRALDFAPVGERVEWRGDNQQSGAVAASAPFRVGKSNCRRLSMTVVNRGEVGRYDITACKRGQSEWRLVL